MSFLTTKLLIWPINKSLSWGANRFLRRRLNEIDPRPPRHGLSMAFRRHRQMLVDDTQIAIRISDEDLRDAAAFHRLDRCVSFQLGRSRRVAMEPELVPGHGRLGMFSRKAHIELIDFHLEAGIEPEITAGGAHGTRLGISADGIEHRCVIRVETREGLSVVGRQSFPELTNTFPHLLNRKAAGSQLVRRQLAGHPVMRHGTISILQMLSQPRAIGTFSL